MTPDSATRNRTRLELAGDGFLITMAVSAALISATLAFGALARDAVAVQIVSSVLTLAGGALGPIAAWLLHRRRVDVPAALGAMVAMPAAGAAFMVLTLLSWPLGWAVSPFTDSEFAGPIAVLALAGAACVALVGWLVADAVRDLRERREHVRVDLARIGACAVVAAFAVGIAAAARTAGGEIAEAPIFALVAGLSGGLMVLGADMVSAWMTRSSGERPGAATV